MMKEVACPICGTKFIKTRSDKKCCSRKCSCAYNKKFRKENPVKIETGCQHNEALVCTMKKCGVCGWNPAVAKRRMETLYG